MKNILLIIVFIISLILGCGSSSIDQVLVESVSAQDVLENIVNDIKTGKYGDTHSLLITQDGKILLNEYFGDWSENRPHYQYSVTKSIGSTLIGIAVDKGYIKSIDDTVLSFFPEYSSIQNLNDFKKEITINDILTMRAGFQWDEWSYSYTDERNDANKLIRSEDMMKFMLDLPMANRPGSLFKYNSGCSMLISGIIEKSTGMTVNDFAKKYLFDRLEIIDWQWEHGRDELYNTGWGLHLKPKDMLKIGQLYLNDGVSNGNQIISKEWIGKSLSNYGNNYGFQWWLSNDQKIFSARGWGGQFIFIMPSKNLIVITTAANFNNNSNPAGFQILDKLKNIL